MKLLVFALLALAAIQLPAQENGFAFGKVTTKDLQMTSYAADTAAAAVVLKEFGEAYIDDDRDNNLLFEYHVLIKVLKKEGLRWGDMSIDLYKQDNRKEFVYSVRASSYNLEQGVIKETALDPQSVYTVKTNEYWEQSKFAVPGVRVGSVIEISYIIESPFIYKFRNWEFQSDIPKMSSEYWASIPGNYLYNITFKGYLKLSKNENVIVKDCFQPGGGHKADCSRYKWAIVNVPAFVTEDHMTAKSNFVAMINFELSEIVYFDGRRDRVTKEWRDAENELRSSDRFGQQLRRGKSIVDGHIDVVIANEKDPLMKAQKIYSFIQGWYQWDAMYGKYSDLGIKKAFDTRKGNVGDINLSLIAALRYAGIEADPLLLSTRANGLPTEIHPVLSDFNYVIAKAKIGDKEYLLDATDDFLPFGAVPVRCLNGKGRVFADKSSYWYDIKPVTRSRHRTLLNMKLDAEGIVRGTVEHVYSGYYAIDVRKDIHLAGSQDSYFNELKKENRHIELTGYSLDNPEDLNKAVTVRLEFEWQCFDGEQAQNFLINPLLFERIAENPFRSRERFYPVDYGFAKEGSIVATLEYPQEYQPTELPAKVGIALPNSAARYGYELKNEGNKITLQSYLTIAKPLFTSEEYHYLKELYSQIVASQQTELLFKRENNR